MAKTASADEIKQAFRALARVHHPDVAKNKVAGEAKFKEINEAYEVLGDPEKRRRYDEIGKEPPPGEYASPPGGQGDQDFEFNGTGFSDFFESFFGGQGGGASRRRGYGPMSGDDDGDRNRPGNDVEADLLVTLEEVLRGSQRKITLRRPGTGDEASRTHTYQVTLPVGIRDGKRIRLAGQGSPGSGSGAAGDLYLRITFARHPDLRIQGDDLYYELPLAPWEAVLGTKVVVPTLGRPTTLKVPPGTLAGTALRLRGQGFPSETGKRGDFYATVTLQVPATASPEETLLWEKLAALSPFSAREKP